MTEVLALQQLEVETGEEAEEAAFPCFSIHASTITETLY
ncbi:MULTISPECIES: class III lanthipeptide [Kitasatospora]|nr:class III lanthipeptide [Kitasatospora phosalacinea]